jgi:putative hydrolase of the HAD superfamily
VVLRAVVFDWGGTLVPWEDLDLVDLWRAAAALLSPGDPEPVAAALAAAEAELWDRCSRTLRSATTAELLAEVSRSTGLPADVGLHDRALQVHLEAMTPHTRCRASAAAVLTGLRDRGLRTGLLSNTHWPRSWHERFLARDRVAHLLDARVYTSDLGHVKPHPAAFQAVLEALGVSPAEAVFVGDRPVDDIAGASAAGMRTVWLPNGRLADLAVEPDAVVRELDGVVALVDRWLAEDRRADPGDAVRAGAPGPISGIAGRVRGP